MEIKGVGEKSPVPGGGSLGGMGNYYMELTIYFFGKNLMRGGAVHFSWCREMQKLSASGGECPPFSQ